MLYIATASIVRRTNQMQARITHLERPRRSTDRQSETAVRRRIMMRAATALLLVLLCPTALQAQSQKTLLLGLASISGGIETLYVTKKIGAFKRNGLDVDFLLLQGGSQALQVLLSGELKLISGGGGGAAQRGGV